MSYNRVEGKLDATGKSFAIVAARFNKLFVDRLIEGAVDAIVRHGGSESQITVIRVPGSFEIPIACLEAAKSKKFDAVIAVGCLIEGETDHYQQICNQVSSGLSRVNMETGIPTTFGVITAKTTEQAQARSGCKAGNLGEAAAVAAIEMISTLDAVRKACK